MSPRLIAAAIGLTLIIGALAALSLGTESCNRKKVEQAEAQSNEAKGEANAHASQAQAIPSHSAALAGASANVDRARAKVEADRKRLETKPSVPVLVSAVADSPVQEALPSPDRVADLVSSQDLLIQAQDGQIKELKAALQDEVSRSEEWKAAFEAERRRSVGLEIALDAQKHISSSGKWNGRFQGFIAGAVAGLLVGHR